MTRMTMLLATLFLLSIVPAANGVSPHGMQAIKKTAALSRLGQVLQIQRVSAISQLLQAQQLSSEASISSEASTKLLILAALSESATSNKEEMPDRKPSRTTSSDSPDNPNSGKPAWDQPRRQDSSSPDYRGDGGDVVNSFGRRGGDSGSRRDSF